ncbi:hypothetical protein KL86DES1_21934 [uncultured Desulfovibrio sp.]|uniref:Uncharacterized protein n=1 Tax=uncultured Desulfovibrio sp. TaxID=167968 RepID=A0A212LAS8_9BACT|nr:hypothetical protein KL86DES1_21929 [uncultured Desulfovibrio sp.]SCM74427.1 hypothetical protein KL86DES1_21932 [uncultured Desulfovibrio sp.]SCM74429.1 hypothetical protein KL86DES1_21934 [uncultured Desulfovibrio sp.]VZH34826.1 conserved protein of unknown function [Desulfovibrio sp. 86]
MNVENARPPTYFAPNVSVLGGSNYSLRAGSAPFQCISSPARQSSVRSTDKANGVDTPFANTIVSVTEKA